MADIIKIKRSDTTATPPSLAAGEIAYSENSGNFFYGRISDGTPVKIGGKTDVDKLALVEANATADQTDAEIKTAYENNADTNAFTDALQTKLNAVEASADITDATNVDAAGAVMNTDSTTASMSFVIDEDSMATDTATQVPTQQSVKAYVDTEIAANLASEMSYKGSYDASTNTPDLDSTPIATAIGDVYTVTVAGTFFTTAVEVGDLIIAETVNATIEANWTVVNKNIDSSAFATAAQGATADSALQDLTSTSITTMSDVFTSMTPADGQVLTFDTTNGWQAEAAGSGVTDFTALNDTPANFTGSGGMFAKVNTGATAIEFVAGIDGGTY